MRKAANSKVHRTKRGGNPHWRKGQSGNPNGLHLPGGMTLDELILSDRYTPPAKLHRILMKQARTNPAALQHLLSRKLGPPPATAPAPDPAMELQKAKEKSRINLKRLSDAQLEHLLALTAAAEGDTEALERYEQEQKRKRGESDEDPKADQRGFQEARKETKDQYDGYTSAGNCGSKPN